MIQAIILISVYILFAILIYFACDYFQPYDPKSDTWSDGDCNKGIALFWPLWVPLVIFASPFILLYFVFERIRKINSERKSRVSKIWEDLVSESENPDSNARDIKSVLSDLVATSLYHPNLLESKVIIKHMLNPDSLDSENEKIKTTIVGRVGDYDFLRDILSQNNLLNKPVLDIEYNSCEKDKHLTIIIKI